MKDPGFEKVFSLYDKGVQFNQQIDLYHNVENNENFFIGKQWEGIEANGNPTPAFNIIRRVTTFQVSKICADNFNIQTTPLSSTSRHSDLSLEQVCDVVNKQFNGLIERNKLASLIREFVRNAGVDGDACLYSWFDPEIETGQEAMGDIQTEIVENTRVIFGNANDRRVKGQPYILLQMRWELDRAKDTAEQNGFDPETVKPDRDLQSGYYDNLTDNKVTVLCYMTMDKETKTVWSGKYVQNGMIEKFRDTGLKRYPIVWMNWDYVQNCYHGYSVVQQVIPNQVLVNQMFAAIAISLKTTAFPKIVYDRTRLPYWDSAIGRAMAMNGGDVNTVAKIMDPGAINPQVTQFITMAIDYTQSLMGASDAALGDARPDNTSAIIALQRASDAPLELIKQNMYQALEDLALVYLDMMRVYYGKRYAQMKMLSNSQQANQPLGMQLPEQDFTVVFDFGILNEIPLSLKVEVGASSYWSEIATVQTLDNLLMQKVISLDEYLERLPDGFVSMKQELIDKRRGINGQQAQTVDGAVAAGQQQLPVEGGGGYGALQRSLNTTGVV